MMSIHRDQITETLDEGRPWKELRTEGLLWLINTTVFHPRGYALCMHFQADGTATGWSIEGDGKEPWQFRDLDLPEGQMSVDDCFTAVSRLLSPIN